MVVIVNSILIGFILLVVIALTATKCYEDYNPDQTVRMEDPFWLKVFSIINSLSGCLLCQCFKVARPKGKKLEVFDTTEWRKWHMKDLDMQKGRIDDEEHKIPIENEDEK